MAREMLGLVWQQTSQRERKRLLRAWGETAAGRGIAQRAKMAQTVASQAWGLLNRWAHPMSHGRREGINHKIKARLRPV